MLTGRCIDGWVVGDLLRRLEGVCEQYRVTEVASERSRQGVLTLYKAGIELDTQLYRVMGSLSRQHVPEIMATGRWYDQIYDVMESLSGKTLADLGIVLTDMESLCTVVHELGTALHEFSENGLRHRGICPEALLVRTHEPLDLVVSGFGSACLSDDDLEIVSPIGQTVYMAPEAVMGAVSAASDWWSLGIVLLEQVTQGACFESVSFQKGDTHGFLLHALTYGVSIPSYLDCRLQQLLAGLLTKDYKTRWQWPEVQAWLTQANSEAPMLREDAQAIIQPDEACESVDASITVVDAKSEDTIAAHEVQAKSTITLMGKVFDEPSSFALAVACPQGWSHGLALLTSGELKRWVDALESVPTQENSMSTRQKALLANLLTNSEDDSVSDDLRLMKVLKVLNSAMPVVYQGMIVTPLWLVDSPLRGYELVLAIAPVLKVLGDQGWLLRLHKRIAYILQRARTLHIEIDHALLRTHILSTSHAKLVALAHQQYLAYPDSNHAGVLSLMERRQLSTEDLIVLLSVDRSQLLSVQAVLAEVQTLMEAWSLFFDEPLAQRYISLPRLTLYEMLDERAAGMAVTGHAQIDAWVERYRIEKRLPIVRLMILLLYPEIRWIQPSKYQYTQGLLDFFEKRVSFSGLVGPLVRMRIGQYTPRVDLAELTHIQATNKDVRHSPEKFTHDFATFGRWGMQVLLNSLLSRDKKPTRFKVPQIPWEVYTRMNRLEREADVYKRDTGVDGLYMGFPFLLYDEPKSMRLPRIAPVFLWPVSLCKILTAAEAEGEHVDLTTGALMSLGYDREREEVRLNPALENILGKEQAQRCGALLEELMRCSSLSIKAVMDALQEIGAVLNNDELCVLPTEFSVKPGVPEFLPAAVLFLVNFTGQAIGEELRALKGLPLAGTALERVFRLDEQGESALSMAEGEVVLPQKDQQYLVVNSDPSQELAIFQAREKPGLLIEGPPGTGKSQTIVNLVADSIGRGETMLIVCQKKAALDVVYKRLVAEGLSQRVLMINDVHADRNQTVRQIRDQLDQLELKQRKNNQAQIHRLTQEREALGIEIAKLEEDLNRYHAGLYAVDASTGMTYKDMVTDLLHLERQDKGDLPVLSLPMVASFAEQLTLETLSSLEAELCAILTQWLAAGYEGSPFEHLRMFSNDALGAGVFKRALLTFIRTKQEAEQAMSAQPSPIVVKSEPQLYRAWFQAHMDTFMTIANEPRKQLIKWLPLFQTPLPYNSPSSDLRAHTVGNDLLEKFRYVLRLLDEMNVTHWNEQYSSKIALLDDVLLQQMVGQTQVMASPSPWYAFLSIQYRKSKKALTSFLSPWVKHIELQDYIALRDAVQLECYCRPLRKELQYILEVLQLPVPTQDSGPELLTYAKNGFHALLQVAHWSELIHAFPDAGKLTTVLRAADVKLLEQLRVDYEVAFVHYALRQKWLKTLVDLEPYFSDPLLEQCRYAIRNQVMIPDTVDKMQEALPQLEAYLAYREKVPYLSLIAQEFLTRLQDARAYLQAVPQQSLVREFARALNREARLVWKARVEAKYPTLLQSRQAWEDSIYLLDLANHEMQGLTQQLLVCVPTDELAAYKDWEGVTRLRGQRALRLREFIAEAEKLGLMRLRPVWLMNPDIASRLLPLRAGLFDTVVYDEASQISVEYALPTLFRGKRVVVSGDEKQMPPSSFFCNQVEMDEEDLLLADVVHGNVGDDDWDEAQQAWNKREIQDCPDLLQLSRMVLPGRTLQIHYRSAYRELIAFSNAAFYASQLNVPVRHPEKEVLKAKPLELIQVNGEYHDQSNEKEAKKVVELLAKLWQQPAQERHSVGVVTFNKKQASLIEQMIYKRADWDSHFRQELSKERQRFESGEDMSVFVKNVENVQGDERDVIIFSTTFGLNKQGVFRRNFGVLGQQGGERRLNVGITRARQKVVLVSSMPIDDISDMLMTQRMPRTPRDYLQAYLEYARLLSSGEFQGAKDLLHRVSLGGGILDLTKSEQKRNGLLDEVERYLKELGVSYQRGSGEGTFYLDFVVEHPKTGLYVLGVECDAPDHALLQSAKAREVWRPNVLKRAVSEVHRISSPHWLQNVELEKHRLREAIEFALKSANSDDIAQVQECAQE